MGPKDMYLVLYNVLCCAGWALVCKSAVLSILSKMSDGSSIFDALSSVYFAPNLASLLCLLWYSQMAALLEIAHAFLRLVRSPVMVTAMQVGSRIVALLAIAYAPSAQGNSITLWIIEEAVVSFLCF
jgi:very-long-chain (3R)-3-hydroxyacyl-CoA dehydratase